MPKIKDLLADPKTKPSEIPERLTEQDLADYLEVSLQTAQEYRRRGTGPKFVQINRSNKFYRLQDIVEWLERRAVTQPSCGGGVR